MIDPTRRSAHTRHHTRKYGQIPRLSSDTPLADGVLGILDDVRRHLLDAHARGWSWGLLAQEAGLSRYGLQTVLESKNATIMLSTLVQLEAWMHRYRETL